MQFTRPTTHYPCTGSRVNQKESIFHVVLFLKAIIMPNAGATAKSELRTICVCVAHTNRGHWPFCVLPASFCACFLFPIHSVLCSQKYAAATTATGTKINWFGVFRLCHCFSHWPRPESTKHRHGAQWRNWSSFSMCRHPYGSEMATMARVLMDNAPEANRTY